MLTMLLAYDAAGDVIATLDYMVARDTEGNVTGLIDFDAHEVAGGAMTEVWSAEGAVGSKVWPEWIGSQAYAFRVELNGPPGQKRVTALVHAGLSETDDHPAVPGSGHRRERAPLEAAIAARIAAAAGAPADIRDLVGGPDRPLLLDDGGRTVGRSLTSGTPASLPVLGRRPDEAG